MQLNNFMFSVSILFVTEARWLL